MASFNILSTCISRDAFGFHKGEKKHTVNVFSQCTSPLLNFAFHDKCSRTLSLTDVEHITDLAPFEKRCVINDFNHEVLAQYTNDSDFLIIELMEAVSMNLGRMVTEEGEHYFTKSVWFNELYKLAEELFPYPIESVNRLKLLDDECMERIVSRYTDWIQNELHYRPEQVILVDTRKVSRYTDYRYLYKFNASHERDLMNQKLKKLNKLFLNHLPGCHLVKFPFGVHSSTIHPWGLTELHYCSDYYEYLYRCFDAIAETEDSKEALGTLYEEYSELLLRKLEQYGENALLQVQNENLLGDLGQEAFCLAKKNVGTIAKAGACYYAASTFMKKEGTLQGYVSVEEASAGVSGLIKIEKQRMFVGLDDLVKGIIGDKQYLDENWYTVNRNTCVLQGKNVNSIMITDDGSLRKNMMNLIRTVDVEHLAGKTVTFSVYARVLQKNDANQGGAIAFIYADNYGKGSFNASAKFISDKWTRYTITETLPKTIKHLTIVLRSYAASNPSGQPAVVEYMLPKLETGSLATGV